MSKDLPIAKSRGNAAETIVFGIGNCGRSDDGLGWAFIDRLQEETAFRGQFEYRYQLQVEDAALISNARQVVFVDSYHGSLPNGFQLVRCEPSREFEFTTHVLPPEAVLSLCRDLYGSVPHADVLMIQGNSWDLQTGMSPDAARHLENALQYFRDEWPGEVLRTAGTSK